MILVYGAAEGNGREVRRLYQERYPQRNEVPSSPTGAFVVLQRNAALPNWKRLYCITLNRARQLVRNQLRVEKKCCFQHRLGIFASSRFALRVDFCSWFLHHCTGEPLWFEMEVARKRNVPVLRERERKRERDAEKRQYLGVVRKETDSDQYIKRQWCVEVLSECSHIYRKGDLKNERLPFDLDDNGALNLHYRQLVLAGVDSAIGVFTYVQSVRWHERARKRHAKTCSTCSPPPPPPPLPEDCSSNIRTIKQDVTLPIQIHAKVGDISHESGHGAPLPTSIRNCVLEHLLRLGNENLGLGNTRRTTSPDVKRATFKFAVENVLTHMSFSLLGGEQHTKRATIGSVQCDELSYWLCGWKAVNTHTHTYTQREREREREREPSSESANQQAAVTLPGQLTVGPKLLQSQHVAGEATSPAGRGVTSTCTAHIFQEGVGGSRREEEGDWDQPAGYKDPAQQFMNTLLTHIHTHFCQYRAKNIPTDFVHELLHLFRMQNLYEISEEIFRFNWTTIMAEINYCRQTQEETSIRLQKQVPKCSVSQVKEEKDFGISCLFTNNTIQDVGGEGTLTERQLEAAVHQQGMSGRCFGPKNLAISHHLFRVQRQPLPGTFLHTQRKTRIHEWWKGEHPGFRQNSPRSTLSKIRCNSTRYLIRIAVVRDKHGKVNGRRRGRLGRMVPHNSCGKLYVVAKSSSPADNRVCQNIQRQPCCTLNDSPSSVLTGRTDATNNSTRLSVKTI
ncbi:hypothetical protein PR048_005374 [Dryococelus australis]|uniref:DUF4817 domain-containing protein n=1 Tax=Dryococelus australis TaxID=614101 RepID=A0ABQ9IA69_9NEOP|nr:hypothetical protein PR048_005374 [Dryococelus australis]